MRYLLILMVALALTITWQTSVVADNPSKPTPRCDSQIQPGGFSSVVGTGEAPCR